MANVYGSLGKAPAIAGCRERAIGGYRGATERGPTSANARARPKEMEKRDGSLQPPGAMYPSML